MMIAFTQILKKNLDVCPCQLPLVNKISRTRPNRKNTETLSLSFYLEAVASPPLFHSPEDRPST